MYVFGIRGMSDKQVSKLVQYIHIDCMEPSGYIRCPFCWCSFCVLKYMVKISSPRTIGCHSVRTSCLASQAIRSGCCRSQARLTLGSGCLPGTWHSAKMNLRRRVLKNSFFTDYLIPHLLRFSSWTKAT